MCVAGSMTNHDRRLERKTPILGRRPTSVRTAGDSKESQIPWFDGASGWQNSAQSAVPRKQMSFRHSVAVPSVVRIIEIRRAGQNRWVVDASRQLTSSRRSLCQMATPQTNAWSRQHRKRFRKHAPQLRVLHTGIDRRLSTTCSLAFDR